MAKAPFWKTIARRDGGATEAMKVPGGMVLKHIDPGLLESSPSALAMVFVPCTPDEAKEWGL